MLQDNGMAKTKVELEIKRHQLWVKKVIRKYRVNVFKSLQESLDQIRLDAPTNIISRKEGLTGKMSSYRMAKEQPSHPTKLTERTGSLIKMLKARGKWNTPKIRRYVREGFRYTTAKSTTFKSPYIKGTIKVLDGFNTNRETYVAELRASVERGMNTGGAVFGIDIETGEKVIRSRRATKQQLAMRFKHETGIRGKRRPFMEPSAKRHGFTVGEVIRGRLNELGSI
jgi:hypothetical protein